MNFNLVDKRNNNSIYCDDNYTYKIFRPDYSKQDVFLEAFITESVDNVGIHVPPVLEVTNMNGQWALRMKLLSGNTLFSLIKRNPSKVKEYLSQMIGIQTNIHKHVCSALPNQRQKFSHYIEQSDLDDTMKGDLRDLLNTSPKHRKICHGNLSPHNIVVCDDDVVITDWNHATQGNASADIAKTYLWMKMNMPDYANIYLEEFCDQTGTSSQYVKNWIPIVAISGLSKGSPKEDEFLRKEISVIEY